METSAPNIFESLRTGGRVLDSDEQSMTGSEAVAHGRLTISPTRPSLLGDTAPEENGQEEIVVEGGPQVKVNNVIKYGHADLLSLRKNGTPRHNLPRLFEKEGLEDIILPTPRKGSTPEEARPVSGTRQ